MAKIGLIPAAGAGVRAYPKTIYTPKVMLEIAGKPIILHNVEILRDKLGIKEIFIIVGYLSDAIKSFLKDGSQFGVKIHYIECRDHTLGTATGLLEAKDVLKNDFVTILGDEVYINSNHEILRDFDMRSFSAACGLMRKDDTKLISKNYTCQIEDGVVVSLEEKPEKIKDDILGVGTYVFTPEIFNAIESTPVSIRSGRVELTDAINVLAKKGRVCPIFLDGLYYNINSVEDYNFANYNYRSNFFGTFKTSVIIPAYNEEESIGYVIRDFLGVNPHEIFVVDNSSTDRTHCVAEKLRVRVETVKCKGYGDTIKYGLDNAVGDILVVVEADHTFRAKDLGKFLEYLKDSDMVIGTRTTRQMIEQGANMQGLLRWGNVFVGKLVEALWWAQEPRFTDVGCTYRAIWKEAYLKIRDNLKSVSPEFSLEMMIEILQARKRIIEIPISYYKRAMGISKHSESYFKISKTALQMLKLIFKKKFNIL